MNLRDYERQASRAFVQRAADLGYIKGRTLDFGCGQQPYRDIVEATHAEYVPYDRVDFPGSCATVTTQPDDVGCFTYQTVLCSHVLQYVPSVQDALEVIGQSLLTGTGHLVLLYPTAWPEVEPDDLRRFTKTGMDALLTRAGYEVVLHERVGEVSDCRFETAREKRTTAMAVTFALGYGVVARA